MRKTISGLLFVIFSVIIFVAYSVRADYCRQLSLDENNTKQVNVSVANGVYKITTTGEDPYIHTSGIDFSYDAKTYYTLSFDYKTIDQFTDLQIFYYDPATISEADSLRLASLPITGNTWRTHNMDFRDSANWKEARHFRFDLGNLPSKTIFIKNIRFRKSSDLISLNLANTKDVTTKVNGDAVAITSTGSDPYLHTTGLNQNYDPSEYYQLAFDYRSTTGINFLQVFFYGPAAIDESNAKYLGGIPASTVWTTFKADMRMKTWGVYEYLRLDFGDEPGRNIEIKNIRLMPLSLSPLIPLKIDFRAGTNDVLFRGRALGSWPMYLDKSGTYVKDQTTFGNDGNIHGAKWYPDGIYGGNAMLFDGIDDYIDCGNDSSLAIDNKFSVTAWINIRADAGTGDLPVITKEGSFQLRREPDSSGRKLAIYLYINANWVWVASATGLNVNEWYHIAATYDANGGSGNLKIYLNGVLENSSSIQGSISVNNNPVYIGRRLDRYFSGIIDKVTIYDDVMSPDDIYASFAYGDERAPTYNISTTGTNSYARTTPPGVYDPKVYHTLAFEYKSTTGINGLKIFCDSGSESDAYSKHCGALAATTSWTTCYFDLSGKRWGQFQRFRLDFGNEANKDIQIRNIRLLPDDDPQWHGWTAAKKNNLNIVDLTDMVGDLPLKCSAPSTVLTVTEAWEGDGSSLGYVTVVKNTHGLNPDNKYYMFYAQHEPPSGIGCAVGGEYGGSEDCSGGVQSLRPAGFVAESHPHSQ